jgi:hypothetical protein
MMVINKMIGSKYSQYLFENGSWIRLIEYLMQENTFMKNRLSEVIDQIHDRESLAMAEHFQNQFIVKDDLFDHILFDLQKENEKWKSSRSIESDIIFHKLITIHKLLKDQLEFIEKDFSFIKRDYNTYLNSLPSII